MLYCIDKQQLAEEYHMSQTAKAIGQFKLSAIIMSAALLSVLLLAPFSASAAPTTIGTITAAQVGTNTTIKACRTYTQYSSGKSYYTLQVHALPAGGVSLLNYKTLNLVVVNNNNTLDGSISLSKSTWSGVGANSVSVMLPQAYGTDNSGKFEFRLLNSNGSGKILSLPASSEYRHSSGPTWIQINKVPGC